MMRRLIILFLFILTVKSVKADYESTLLPELIFESNLIVSGNIVRVDKKTIEVNIKSVLKGDYKGKIITISKFDNWTCAQRFDTYSIGQDELFFLSKGIDTYEILGAGNEGEIPIIDNKIYYKSLYLRFEKEPLEYKVYNGSILGYIFDLTEFENAIKYYLKNRETIKKSIQDNKKYNLKKLNNNALNRIIDELRDKYDTN